MASSFDLGPEERATFSRLLAQAWDKTPRDAHADPLPSLLPIAAALVNIARTFKAEGLIPAKKLCVELCRKHASTIVSFVFYFGL